MWLELSKREVAGVKAGETREAVLGFAVPVGFWAEEGPKPTQVLAAAGRELAVGAAWREGDQ